MYNVVTIYIPQQRNILTINTNYQCPGLFQGQGQGQGYFNWSITFPLSSPVRSTLFG